MTHLDTKRCWQWDKETSEIKGIFQGDGQVVNVLQGHPYLPIFAISGIDDTAKIFAPVNQLEHQDEPAGQRSAFVKTGNKDEIIARNEARRGARGDPGGLRLPVRSCRNARLSPADGTHSS